MNPWWWDWAADCPWNSRRVMEAGAEGALDFHSALPADRDQYRFLQKQWGTFVFSSHTFASKVEASVMPRSASVPAWKVPHAHPSFPQAGLEASLRSSPDALCLGSDVLPKVLSIWPYWWAPQLSQWMLTPSIWSAEPGARHSFPSSPPCCSTLSHSVRTLQSICTCLPDTSPPLISTTKV